MVPFNAGNTLVIAGSASNGGAAVLHAAEQDTEGLIDGVVADEPVTEMPTAAGYGILFGGVAVTGYGKTLADYVTYANLYQPCAALAAPAAMAEVSVFNYLVLTAQTGRATARCTSLAAKGLVNGADTAARSLDALNKLQAFGWTTFNDQMHNAHYGLGNAAILSAMYPTSYGRFSVTDNVCNSSFAQVDVTGAPVAVSATTKAQSFALANGTANGTPASTVYNDSVGGPRVWNIATSVSTGVQDFGLDNALCQRALVTGVDETGAPLGAVASSTRPTAAQSTAVRAGIAEVLLNGKLQGKPTIIVAGRSDALVPINNNSRAYVAYNKVQDGAEQGELHRGRERAALRHLHSVQRLRQSLRSAARLLRAGDGRDVRQPQERDGAAAEPGRPGDAARRRTGRRAGDHRGQRAGRSAPRRRRRIRSASSALR